VSSTPAARDLPMDGEKSRAATKRIHSGFLDLGSLRVHHMHGGRGAPVVFVHGLGSSGYMEWRRNLEPVAAKHRVFAPDLPGYGRTDKPRVRYTIPYFARFIRRYMHDRGLRSAALIGASLGGRVALEVALEEPALVRRLVLVNTLGLGRPQVRMAQMAYGLVTIPRVGEAVMGFARDALTWAPRTVIRRVAARYAGASGDLEQTMDDDYLDNLREMYATAGYHNAYLSTVRSLVNPRALFGGHHDVTRRLNELKIPVQLIWGGDDPLFPLAHAERAQTLIERSQLAVLDGAGHTPQAERPEEFNRVLQRFLDG
jgi:pimeloyl-ACP methyl ester carboxylesterase